jgi:hypothetical protein
MSKAVKIFLIIAVALIVAGCAIGGVGFAQGGMRSVIWDGSNHRPVVLSDAKLGDTESVNRTYTDVKNITVKAGAISAVRIIPGEKLTVNAKSSKILGGLSARTEGDTLVVTAENRRIFGIFNIVGIIPHQNKSFIEITVPEGMELNQVKIDADYPKVTVSGLTADDFDISCDMGAVTIENTNAGRLYASASMGAVTIENTSAGELSASADMGALKLRNVKAGTAKIDLDAGDATLVGFESGGLDLSCDMGGVNIDGVLKGVSEINCNMGGIKLNLRQPEDSLSWIMRTDMGAAYINGRKSNNDSRSARNEEGFLKITANMGGINLNFVV